MAATDWNPLLRDQFDEPYWKQLQQFVASERASTSVYPSHENVFAALHLTPYADARVVILGQDPYHGPGQAHGLSFSVPMGVDVPPSLRNIHQELQADLGIAPPGHGNLESWARHGVLLQILTNTGQRNLAGYVSSLQLFPISNARKHKQFGRNHSPRRENHTFLRSNLVLTATLFVNNTRCLTLIQDNFSDRGIKFHP